MTSENEPDRGDRAPGLDTRELFNRVYEELHGLAAAYLKRERAAHTLQPTALVHEAFLRLADQQSAPWKTEQEFIAMAAGVMRRALVDHARRRGAAKRGGGQGGCSIDGSAGCDLPARNGEIDVLALNDAMVRLEALQPRQARLVELRVFGGMTMDQAAAAMEVGASTAYRDWEMARAWLLRELGG